MEVVLFDFEYNPERVVLCCAEVWTDGEAQRIEWDLRSANIRAEFLEWVEGLVPTHLFVSHYIQAEIDALHRLGFDLWQWDLRCACTMSEAAQWILCDPYAKQVIIQRSNEFKQQGLIDYEWVENEWGEPVVVSDSNRHLFKKNQIKRHRLGMLGLIECQMYFGVVPESIVQKEATRDLILRRSRWSAAEWDRIVRYCWSDIDALRELFLAQIEQARRDFKQEMPEFLEKAELKGRYLYRAERLDRQSSGFPFLVDTLDFIKANPELIRNTILPETSSEAGSFLKRDNHGNLSKNIKGIENWLDRKGYLTKWPKTATGQPKLSMDVVDTKADQFPEVGELKRVLKTDSQLKSGPNFLEPCSRGFLPQKTRAFRASTSRSSFSHKENSPLNLVKWMRHMIQPKPGWYLVSLDWSQQEIGIAAYLSGCDRMIAAFESGDIYVDTGQRYGMITGKECSQEFKLKRGLLKNFVLGLSYGKQAKSLGSDFLEVFRQGGVTKTLPECVAQAEDLFRWHRREFRTYWQWIEGEVAQARARGYAELADWTRYVEPAHPVKWRWERQKRQLLNFPIQGTGARMMREATCIMAEAPWLDFCSAQHDGFWFNAEGPEELEATLAYGRAAMEEAQLRVLPQAKIGVEEKIYSEHRPFRTDCEVADRLWARVKELQSGTGNPRPGNPRII